MEKKLDMSGDSLVIVETEDDQKCRKVPPNDYKKMFLALIYMAIAYAATSYVTVVVHDRLPKPGVLKQLPDLFLDNVAYRDWALGACEIIMMILIISGIILSILHKHRFVLARRCAVILSTIMLLRCTTIVVTSLPALFATYPKCFRTPPTSSLNERISRALLIFRGMGMSIQGVTTCGDYIYSGHTVNMVAVTLTLIEYSPHTFTLLHWIFRLLCLAAMILILVAHEHYTVDVVLALYITSQMFTNYHMLAENPSIRNSQPTHRRLANLWYPIVRFFEENVQGPVPNEYEWPFGSPDSSGTRHLSLNVGCVARLWCAMNAEICRRLGSKGGRPSIT